MKNENWKEIMKETARKINEARKEQGFELHYLEV